MARKRQNITNMLNRTMSSRDLVTIWSDDYSTLFRPNIKKLLKTHKVPKFKRRYADNW